MTVRQWDGMSGEFRNDDGLMVKASAYVAANRAHEAKDGVGGG